MANLSCAQTVICPGLKTNQRDGPLNFHILDTRSVPHNTRASSAQLCNLFDFPAKQEANPLPKLEIPALNPYHRKKQA